MTGALTRRLQRLLDRQARATAPERRVTRIHVFDLMPASNPLTACQQPSWTAYLAGDPDITGFCEAWLIEADSPSALEAAVASLSESGDVPTGEWRRSARPACPGGLACEHVPHVILGDGSAVSMADLGAIGGRA